MGKQLNVIQPSSFLKYDPEVDGVTNGLLTAWGNCRELARLGLRGWTRRGSSFALTYGDLTHWLFQHVYSDHQLGRLKLVNGELTPGYIKAQLTKLEGIWKAENPVVTAEQSQQMELTLMLNELVMPFYFRHWKTEFKEVKWLGLESEFKVPFTVERNGIEYRTFLRGKRDGLFEVAEKKDRGVWLFETKTKGRIDELLIQDTLPFESQINLYVVASEIELKKTLRGVRYNIVRRPGLRQKKKETTRQFAQRMVDDIEKRPTWYFLRQKMTLERKDVEKYLGELEDRVWEFMHWWKGQGGHWRNSGHCQNQYGTCHMLRMCSGGDTTPYYLRDRIFGELSGEAV